MKLKLTRPLCVLDIESATRGPRPDPAIDKIVSLCIVKLHPDGNRYALPFLFNPGFQMSAENIALHGITNEEVADCQLFNNQDAAKIQKFIDGCDIGGFNCTGYDNPLLWEECYSVGVTLDFDNRLIIDAGNIFKKKEERSLSAALKFYCGREHSGAHNAMGDVEATIEVLEGQLDRYPDLAGMDTKDLAAFCKQTDRVDLFGTIIRDKNGVPCFGTKRNYMVPVANDVGYANWILRSDFPANTKHVIEKLLHYANNPEDGNGRLL